MVGRKNGPAAQLGVKEYSRYIEERRRREVARSELITSTTCCGTAFAIGETLSTIFDQRLASESSTPLVGIMLISTPRQTSNQSPVEILKP